MDYLIVWALRGAGSPIIQLDSTHKFVDLTIRIITRNGEFK